MKNWLPLVLALVVYKVESAREAERYTINLDSPPSQRWNDVVVPRKAATEALVKLISSKIHPLLQHRFSLMVSSGIENYVPYPYSEELKGIASLLDGVTTAEVLMANFYYEVTAFNHNKYQRDGMACTSIVAETTNGTIIHGRNLDHMLRHYLKNITVIVDFQKNGSTSYTGSTFAGYVGLATGQKPYRYTISFNQRNEGHLWMNVVQAWIYGMNGSPSLTIRDVLDREDLTFESAVHILSTKPLIASCYFAVGGVEPGEGVIITRSRTDSISPEKLDDLKNVWYVLETNYDHWRAPPPDDNRRDPGIRAMESMTRDNLTPEGLYDVLSVPPVRNYKTKYTAIMSAANPFLYSTKIR